MAKSKIIGLRIPDHLLREIENFGLTKFPKNESFDMTKSLLFLIQRGLQNEGIESPKSLSPSPSGDLDIDSNFKIHVLNDIENLKGLINDYQKQLKDNIDNLESQIDEFKESQIAINDRLYSKIENLETQSNQDVKPLIDESKKQLNAITILEKLDNLTDIANNLKEDELIFSDKELRELNDLELDLIYQKFKEVGHFGVGWSDDSSNKRMTLLKCKMNKGIFKQEQPPADHSQKPVNLSKFYPNQKIFKPYHVEQFKVIYDLLIGFNISFLSTKNNDAIQQWIISDQEGNKAALFLNGASHWSLEKVNFGDGDLKGFFEDCNFNDNYLDDLLIANNIDLDEIAEGADQSASATIDSPDPLGLSLGIISHFDFFSKTGITIQTLNNWFKEDRAIPQKYQDYIEIHNKENKELLIKKLPIPIKQK